MIAPQSPGVQGPTEVRSGRGAHVSRAGAAPAARFAALRTHLSLWSPDRLVSG